MTTSSESAPARAASSPDTLMVQALLEQVARRVVGQEYMVERLLIGLLTGGHVLLEGVPGLAKTLTVKTLAETINTSFQRIQFTPDLLPADVLGTQIFDQQTGEFRAKKGPIFANIILADEINRAPAKVQAALLEAMQEKQVTIGSTTYVLEEPFLVLATQNPIEQEGTYALPEAQVDRFMLKLHVGYPTRAEEKEIMRRMAGGQAIPVEHAATPQAILEARKRITELYLDDRIVDYIVDIVHATRAPADAGLKELAPLIEYGASPRATIFLAQAARAHAFLRGRAFVTPDDVKAIAPDVLRHRVLTTYEAEAEEVTSDAIVTRVLAAIEAPLMGAAVSPEMLRQVRLLELRTRGLVNTVFSGEYHSVFKGQGMEFAEVREYQAGDEVRSIDWNVTARMQHPYVKRYIEERELTVMLAADLSGSQRFGTVSRFKSELTTELAAVLAMSAIRNNDRVGTLMFTDRVEHVVPPRKGRRHAMRVIRDLLLLEPAGTGTDIGGAIDYLMKMLPNRAIVFLLSDFVDPNAERPLKLLAQRHDVVAVTVEDPREIALPDIGLARFANPETGATIEVNTSDPRVRAGYDEALRAERAARTHLLRRLAIDEIAVRTDRSYIEPLLRFFRRRSIRRRR